MLVCEERASGRYRVKIYGVGATRSPFGRICWEIARKYRLKIGTNVPFPWAVRFGTLVVEGMP